MKKPIASTNPVQLAQYSSFNPKVLDKEGRLTIAKQLKNILNSFPLQKDLKYSKILDIGCSSGIITGYLAKYCSEIYGIDVDKEAVNTARKTIRKKNLYIKTMDILKNNFPNNYFDILICNQVYYCVKDPKKLMNEMYRILKSGGICFFGARNKYALWEGQYHLPLLTFLPQFVSILIVRLAGKAKVYVNSYLSFWELEKLCRKFTVHHYTPKILSNPRKYGFKKFESYAPFLHAVPFSIWERIEPLLPNFIWILEKN